MTTIDYVPLEAALLDIYSIADSNHFTKPEVEEWASWAMQDLHVRPTYQEDLAITEVVNYKTCIPRGTKYIWQIFWKETLEDNDLQSLVLYTGNESAINKKFIEFQNNSYFNVNWKPMRAATSPFSRSVLCKNALQTHVQCEHTYSLDKTGTITTTLPKGYLAIAYLSYPKDNDGNFLIPNEQVIMKALKNYCLMKIWERQMNYGVDNAERLFHTYLGLWEVSAANARGKQMLLGPDQLENLKQQQLRIGQHTNSYYTAFGNLAHGENIVL